MSKVHRLKTPFRTCRIEITETSRRTFVALHFSRVGDFDDQAAIIQWLQPILAKYEGDGKPIVMRNPRSGEVATVYDPGIAVVQRSHA